MVRVWKYSGGLPLWNTQQAVYALLSKTFVRDARPSGADLAPHQLNSQGAGPALAPVSIYIYIDI